MRRALLPLALTALLAGCGGTGKTSLTTTSLTTTVERTVTATTNPTGTASVTTHGRFHYPKVVVDNYMKSCTSGDNKKQAYCACTLDKLSNNVSVQDFARIGEAGGKVPPRISRLIRKAATDCLDKL